MASSVVMRGAVCRNCLDKSLNYFFGLFSRYLPNSVGRRKFSVSRNHLRLSKHISRVCQAGHINKKSIESISLCSLSTYSTPSDIRRGYVPGVSKIERTITAKDEKGLCLIALPLYSRDEVCRFVLKPLLNTLNDFYYSIRAEDPGIEKIRSFTTEGELISQNTTCANLLKNDFVLQMNGLNYLIKLDGLDFSSPYLEGDSVKNLVAQLYMAINSEEVFIKRQEMLQMKLEELQVELLPMEKSLSELHDLAVRKTRMLAWSGLGLMGLQFGILARLTWWEYSWDVMEPVTYFITYGTIMAMFSYYIVSNQEYMYPEVNDRQVVRQLHNIVKRGDFDLVKYNELIMEVSRVKFELARLRDPIKLRLHPAHLKPNAILPTL